MIMAKEVISTPPGYRFKPRDDELINFYLKPKVLGHKLPCHIIPHIELYTPDSTPWLMFDADSWDDENSLYVFTSLSKISADPDYTSGKSRYNKSKKAGCGTWVQKTSRVPIKDVFGNVIGGRKMLLFKVDETGDGFDESKAVCYRMHEFSLCGVNDGLCCNDGTDLVLCKISFDVSKKALFNVPDEETDSVSKTGGKSRKRKQRMKKNLKGSVDVINTMSSNPESSVPIDGGVGTEKDWSATDLQNLEDFLASDDVGNEGIGFDGLGGENLSFDIDGFINYLNSTEEEELREDKTMQSLGKRKSIEGDNSHQTKKMCF